APPPPPKEEEKFFVTTYDPPFVLIRKAFNDLPKKKFYLVFSLLATRLSKAEKQDSDVVMEIMRSLLNEYPHQCTLLSMGEARCSTKK
uniref:DNA_ligase_A_N domain-containing protein n=3 Tax=Bursaphelenchus xylophilus TaxID=6326 RepID=A0A1I7SPM9_BURXY